MAYQGISDKLRAAIGYKLLAMHLQLSNNNNNLF